MALGGSIFEDGGWSRRLCGGRCSRRWRRAPGFVNCDRSRRSGDGPGGLKVDSSWRVMKRSKIGWLARALIFRRSG